MFPYLFAAKGYTLAHHAAYAGEGVLQLVLDAGCAFDTLAKNGLSPLAYALSSAKPRTALMLFKKGADPRKPLVRVSARCNVVVVCVCVCVCLCFV